MRNLHGAAADEFADDGVAGDDVVALHLVARQAFDGFEQIGHAFVADVGVEEAGVAVQSVRGGPIALLTDEEGLQRGEVEGEAAVDDVVGGAVERDDAEQLAGADVMPVQERQQRTVVAMLDVAQHAAHEADVGELGQTLGAAVAFEHHVLRFDVELELRAVVDAFGDRRVEAVQAIEQQDLVLLELHRFGAGAAAFFEAVNGFLDGLAVEQADEVLVQELDVQRLGRFVIAIVDPIGRMLHERPEIIVEVQHQEAQALLLQTLGQLDGRGRLSAGTRAADPHHAQLIAFVEAGHDFGGGFVERLLVIAERLFDDPFQLAALHDFVQAGDSVDAARFIPFQDLVHRRVRETVADERFLRDRAFTQPMAAPTIAGVGIGGALETVAAQDVQDGVLDHLDRRREIGDEMMLVGIETDDDGIGQERGERFVGVPSGEKFFVDAGQAILLEAADGLAGFENGATDFVGIEFNERPIALLNFDNAILNHKWNVRERSSMDLGQLVHEVRNNNYRHGNNDQQYDNQRQLMLWHILLIGIVVWYFLHHVEIMGHGKRE